MRTQDEANRKRQVLGIFSPLQAHIYEGKTYIHLSYGRVIDDLANRYQKILLCAPIHRETPADSSDYCLQSTNIEVIAQPAYETSLGALKHAWGIGRAYRKTCRQADVLFIRGMIPYVGLAYFYAKLYYCLTCHWVVGNSIGLLRSHRRAGALRDLMAMVYALQDRFFTRLGRWLINGAFVCNGQELGDIFHSPRTIVTVSTTLTREEFYERFDTCQDETIRILFIGFIRPEKGVEFLLEAMTKLRTDKNWRLAVYGPRDRYPEYQKRLNDVVDHHKLNDRIYWGGYLNHGPDMWKVLRQSDLFVLPTLSEGTPRVLVEARANSLPIVATCVGGIPTSVTHGWDGLLVPPRDPQALAMAIESIITDNDLRRSLIRNGLNRAKNMTVECFVDIVMETLQAGK